MKDKVIKRKGIIIASAVAATVMIGGCAQQSQPMPGDHHAYQSGHSSKLGKMGGSSCKGKKSYKKHS